MKSNQEGRARAKGDALRPARRDLFRRRRSEQDRKLPDAEHACFGEGSGPRDILPPPIHAAGCSRGAVYKVIKAPWGKVTPRIPVCSEEIRIIKYALCAFPLSFLVTHQNIQFNDRV